MQNYTEVELKCPNKGVEQKLITLLKGVLKPFTDDYSKFFFTRGETADEEIITLYFEQKAGIIKESINNLNRDEIELKVRENVEFNETEGRFGNLGDNCLATFYKLSNKISIDSIENSIENYSDKLEKALDLLIIFGHFNYGSIKKGYFSYASHSNGFFTRWEDSVAIEKVFYEKYNTLKDVILEKIDTLAFKGNLNKEMKSLVNALEELKREVKENLESGELKFFKQEDKGNPDLLYKSEFHRAIKDNPDFTDYMEKDMDFLSSRMFTIYSYFLIKKIGIKNKDRYLLGYFIYKAVEEHFKLDTISTIKNFKKTTSLR